MISKEEHLIKELKRSNQPILVITSENFSHLLGELSRELDVRKELISEFNFEDGVENLRIKISEALAKPISQSSKILIIKDIEKLNIEQSNTLLKLLEEPPQHLKIIMSAANLSAVIKTIRSRSKCFVLSVIKNTYDREMTIINLLQLSLNDYLQVVNKMTKEEFKQSLFEGLEELKKNLLNKEDFLSFENISEILNKVYSTNVNYKLLAESLYVNEKAKQNV